ncbi:MAG: PMT family glycosyltransferase, 4-amino-4-deoxy-L-arabinose transferase [Microgenomates group bacterium Gr01-1014_7]|nr:MAG: PMT family glycosyltransferase, 4-amino-4-deoxy-L-arabinose transferase [Microgenomates group bacterium Gr01-1014_7]
MFFLFIILLFGFAMRIYHVARIPPGFFADEASVGYNAYTILTKGEDEGGNKFPILFQNFGTFYRPGISIYLSAPFVWAFGLNEFSLRLAAAIFGTISIVLTYGVARLLFSSRTVAVLAAFFLAISPWHIHFSRTNQDFIYFVCFLTLSTFLFLLGVKRNYTQYLVLSFFSFGLTLYTYVPAYFITPLFVLLILLIYRTTLLKMKNATVIGIAIFICMTIPLFLGLENGKTLSRFHQVSTANQQKSSQEIIQKAMVVYRDHFMPEFLFEKGDIGYHTHFITRFSVRGMGQLYWFQLPLILAGLLYVFHHNKKNFLLIIGWLTLYPLGSTAVPFADGGGPFATRSIIGVIPFQLVSAAGLYFTFSLVKNHLAKLLVVLLLVIIIASSFKTYLHLYFVEYPTYAADFWGWQYGSREIMHYFKDNKDNYDYLFLGTSFNAPEIFIKFYDPTNICKNKCQVGDFDRFDTNQKQLFAFSSDHLVKTKRFNIAIKQTIYYPNGQPAFYIAELERK